MALLLRSSWKTLSFKKMPKTRFIKAWQAKGLHKFKCVFCSIRCNFQQMKRVHAKEYAEVGRDEGGRT